MLLSVRLNFSLSLKVFKVLIVMKVGMVSKEDLKEQRCFKPILVFILQWKMEKSANKGGVGGPTPNPIWPCLFWYISPPPKLL